MRISFRNRNLGHPLLTSEPRDYTVGRFDIAQPDARHSANGISLNIAYQMESQYLASLVTQGDAAFQTLIVGDGSFLREATPPTRQALQQYTLDTNRWAGTIEMMPFLTAAKRITGFASDEHDPEFGMVQPAGFTIEPGMILAIGNIHEVDIDETASASSVVDIQPHKEVARGEFRIELAQPHIIVYVSPAEFESIQHAINDPRDSRRQTLWPSIYLHVIIEGIRKLPEFQDYMWVAAFERALRNSGYDPDDHEALRNNALQYAQRIIYDEKKRYPLGLMLDAFAEEDADPRSDERYE